MKAKLVVVGGDAKAAEVNLKLPTIIGRGREAPLTLPHPLVSRQHCEIFEQNGRLVVRDLGSLNGTFINNERITEAVLPNGELLTIGTVTFRAVYDDSAAAKTAAKTPPKPRKPVAGEKTIGQPSDPTVDVGPAAHPKPAPAKAQPAPKAAPVAAKAKGKATSDTSEAAAPAVVPKPAKADAPSKVGKGSQVAKAAAKAADQEVTLKAPAAKETPAAAAPPKKKAWADTAAEVEPVDFTDADDDFELGEDDDFGAAAALPAATEFTMQITKPAGFSRRKPEDEDDFDVQELDFSGPGSKASQPAEPSVHDAGDLTTNFDPKKLAEDDRARKAAKEQTNAPAAKTPAPKAPAPKAPAKPEPKAPAINIKVPSADSAEEDEAPKKGNLANDEDLEAFFKSLG